MMMVNSLHSCPACTAALCIKSDQSNYITCGTCGAISKLVDGTCQIQSILPVIGSNDVIQPGTRGECKGKTFEVLGRVRFWMKEYVLNYWTLLWENGEVGYLEEGYGLYTILTFREGHTPINSEEECDAGEVVHLFEEGDDFLQTYNYCIRIELEGEVWLPLDWQNLRFFDFTRSNGENVTLLAGKNSIQLAFTAFDASFDALRLTQLSTKEVKPFPIICIKCKKYNEIKSYPYAQSYTCQCGQRVGLNNAIDFKGEGRDKGNKNKLELPLGTRGLIKNIDYEVVGYALKVDEEKSTWKEYVLYNRQEGYAFLNEYMGHWIYSREKQVAPFLLEDLEVKQFHYKGRYFDLFNRYNYSIADAHGELPGNPFGNAKSCGRAYEFISIPYMWVFEREKGYGISCFLAEHIEPAELEAAFGVQLGGQVGVGIIQPNPLGSPARMGGIGLIAVLLLLMVHLLFTLTEKEKVVLMHAYTFPDSVVAPVIVSESFELTKWKSNLEFEIFAAVNNDWFDVEIDLVNAKTGEEFSVDQGVEYYHGVDEGESWTEGSTNETTSLSSIPAGTYFLRMTPSRGSRYVSEFSIRVTNDVVQHRNFFVFLLLLGIWPAIMYYRSLAIERERWYNSPYSNYTYNE